MEQLCRKINMPQEVTEILISLDRTLGNVCLEPLRREETWETGLTSLREQLGEDPDGFRELCCMLRCAKMAREECDSLGFTESEYYATFGCFSRFVREHLESFGRYGFDRGFWTVRQISCRLFRIGELEYELTELEGEPAVSIHIPSDAKLKKDLLEASLKAARERISESFPDYAGSVMYCQSWLLSPTLGELLPESSNILTFQSFFEISPLPEANEDVALWVFKNPDLPVQQYPENTSLQRKLKQFLLQGGLFRDAKGILRA